MCGHRPAATKPGSGRRTAIRTEVEEHKPKQEAPTLRLCTLPSGDPNAQRAHTYPAFLYAFLTSSSEAVLGTPKTCAGQHSTRFDQVCAYPLQEMRNALSLSLSLPLPALLGASLAGGLRIKTSDGQGGEACKGQGSGRHGQQAQASHTHSDKQTEGGNADEDSERERGGRWERLATLSAHDLQSGRFRPPPAPMTSLGKPQHRPAS